jgi:hypothetical protein
MSTQVQDIHLVNSGAPRLRIDRFDVLCVLTLLFSFLVVSNMPAAPSKYGDKYFHAEAKILAHALRKTTPYTDVTFARAPGPSLYYAVPYAFASPYSSDETYWKIAFGWNIAWMIVAVFLIRRTGDYLADKHAGHIAVFLTLIVPLGVYYSFGVSAETPAFVAAALFLYGWARWQSEDLPGFT